MADLTSRCSGFFARAAQWTSRQCGRPLTFGLSALAVLIWAATGPIFHYSDTWQLVINTGTTIITFLMVFLIQNTQNRESAAVLLKLDELIRASEFARNRLLTLEDLTEDELMELKRGFAKVAQGSEIGVGQVEEAAGA
jgi:low affinity Fe/Cu permease